MSIDLEAARKAAHLARIRVTEDELPGIARELSSILEFMERLGEVDVENVAAMSSVTPMKLQRRPDRVETGGDRDRVLSNAPAVREGFFAVPKVVE